MRARFLPYVPIVSVAGCKICAWLQGSFANHAMLLLQMAGLAATIDTVQNTEYAGDVSQ